MSEFYGRTYVYPTPSHGDRPIGVTTGLCSNVYIVAYISPITGRKHWIKPCLPPDTDPNRLQRRLDDRAKQLGLRPALPEARS